MLLRRAVSIAMPERKQIRVAPTSAANAKKTTDGIRGTAHGFVILFFPLDCSIGERFEVGQVVAFARASLLEHRWVADVVTMQATVCLANTKKGKNERSASACS